MKYFDIAVIGGFSASDGRAAGTAAAMSVRKKCDIRNVNIENLKQALLKNGAFLGK